VCSRGRGGIPFDDKALQIWRCLVMPFPTWSWWQPFLRLHPRFCCHELRLSLICMMELDALVLHGKECEMMDFNMPVCNNKQNLELPFMLGGPRCSALEEEFDHFHPLFPTVLHNWRLLHGICAGQFVMAVR
jgi:hypothetical protein